jgi:hypothetical protein
MKIVVGIAVVMLLAAAIVFAPGSDFWTTTSYCPWNHRIGYTPRVCKVKDRDGGRVLVEHANLDSNQLQLSITQEGRRMWIRYPDKDVMNLSNSLDENKILFDDRDKNLLSVNGERFPITASKEN